MLHVENFQKGYFRQEGNYRFLIGYLSGTEKIQVLVEFHPSSHVVLREKHEQKLSE